MKTRPFAWPVARLIFPARFSTVKAEGILPAIFSDHAVLQRGDGETTGGRAAKGETVTASLAEKTASATTEDAGEWFPKVGSLTSGGPHTLAVQGKIEIKVIPVSVRYAGSSDPIGNLVNSAGISASPFRTDNWGK